MEVYFRWMGVGGHILQVGGGGVGGVSELSFRF